MMVISNLILATLFQTWRSKRWLGLLGQVFGFLKWNPCGLRLSTVLLAEGPSRP